MSENLHPNATPNVVFTGADDRPGKGAAKPLARFANFTLLNPVIANWGTTKHPLAISNGAEAETHYGPDFLNVNGPYYNYQTALTELQIGGGTPTFPWRMAMPGMAKANGRLFIEIVEDDLIEYQRNLDGTYTLTDGAKVPTGNKVPGIKYRFLYENNINDFIMGNAVSGAPGTLTGMKGETATTSLIYPVADFEGLWEGTFGNQLGMSFYNPKEFEVPIIAANDLRDLGNAIYRLAMTVQPRTGGSANKHYTNSSSAVMDFMLEPEVVTSKNVEMHFEPAYEKAYAVKEGLTSGSKHDAPVVVHWYEDDIVTVLTKMHAAEVAAKPAGDETIFVSDNIYSVNMMDGLDNFNVPYRAIRVAAITDVPNAKTVLMNSKTRLALKGGNDGDISNAAFNTAVKEAFDNIQYKFPVTDLVQYPFHWIVDCGFDQEVSEALFQINQHRADVAVIPATHEFGKPLQTTAEIQGSGLGLATAALLYPESLIYTTPASRGAIMGYTIRLVGHKYRKPISANYELAEKLQAYLGRVDGVWVIDRDPMLEENKPFKHTLLNFSSEPFTTRSEFWKNQIIALGSVGHETVGITGMQSVHPNDSSVLNSLLVIAALIQATYAAGEAAIRNQGRTALPSVIGADIDKAVVKACKGIDTGKARIAVKSYQTQADKDNTFSLTTKISLEGAPQITANAVILQSSFMKDEAA